MGLNVLNDSTGALPHEQSWDITREEHEEIYKKNHVDLENKRAEIYSEFTQELERYKDSHRAEWNYLIQAGEVGAGKLFMLGCRNYITHDHDKLWFSCEQTNTYLTHTYRAVRRVVPISVSDEMMKRLVDLLAAKYKFWGDKYYGLRKDCDKVFKKLTSISGRAAFIKELNKGHF